MSTLGFASLTTARQTAPKGTSFTVSPGVGAYLDAFAALVPAEVLALHAAIISLTTVSQGDKAVIKPEGLSTLSSSFWILIVLSMALYVVPRVSKKLWDSMDFVRVLIPPLAFVGWTALQPVSAFDAAGFGIAQIPRTVYALILGVVLGGVTALLAYRLDKQDPPGGAGQK